MPLVFLAIAGLVAMETFWGGLALAAITAFVWVAYQHPKSYARLYPFLAAIQTGIVLIGGSYYIGHQQGWYAAEVVARATNPTGIGPWQEPFSYGWVFLASFGFGIFNLVLVYLHQILGLTGGGDKPPTT